MNKIQFSDSATEVTIRMAKSILKKGKKPLYVFDPVYEIEYQILERTDLNYSVEMEHIFFIKNNK